MNTKRKAEAVNFGSKTNLTGGEIQAFSSLNCSTESGGLEHISAILDRVIKNAAHRPEKVIRLYRCFACKRNFPLQRMSSCLAVCRECSTRTQGKGRIARLNEIDRITNSIRVFLRARLEAK